MRDLLLTLPLAVTIVAALAHLTESPLRYACAGLGWLAVWWAWRVLRANYRPFMPVALTASRTATTIQHDLDVADSVTGDREGV